MKTLTETDLKKIDDFMMNKSRDIELAYYNYFFQNGEALFVSYALSMYQNSDGGFGHGLEPDNMMKESNAIATSKALSMLKNVGFNKNNLDDFTKNMIKKALNYSFTKIPRKGDYFYPSTIEVSKYPHAQWWNYSENMTDDWKYNPSILLASYYIYFLDSRSKFYNEALALVKRGIDFFIDIENDFRKDFINCYKTAYEILTDLGIDYRLEELFNKIISDAKKAISKPEDWGKQNYPTIPTDLFDDEIYLVDEELSLLVNKSLDFLIDSRMPIGVWDINWKWNNYEEEYEVARIKWTGVLAVNNLILLQKFKRVQLS